MIELGKELPEDFMSSGPEWSKNRFTHGHIVSPKNYRCPKHGETDQAIHFHVPDKKYCILCWHDWMAANIPALERSCHQTDV